MTWIATIWALLPTPAGGFPVAPQVMFPLLPAAMPAVIVPWKQSCFEPLMHCGVSGSAAPAPLWLTPPLGHSEARFVLPPVLEKHASAITLPAKNSWVPSTPLSRIATERPPPVAPLEKAPPTPVMPTSGT